MKALEKMFKCHHVTIPTKIRIMQAGMVFSVTSYGSKSEAYFEEVKGKVLMFLNFVGVGKDS